MAETTRIPDVMLERYVAGDLKPEQRARIEAAASATPAVAARIKAIETERNAFLTASPPEAAAHRIVTRLAVEREKQPRRFMWWLFPPVGVAAALLFGVVYQRSLGPQSIAPAPQVMSDDAYELAQREPARAWDQPGEEPGITGGSMQPQPEQKIAADIAPRDEASSMSRGAVGPAAAAKSARPRTQADRSAAADREDDARITDKAAQMERRSAKKDSDGLSEGGGLGRASTSYAQPPPSGSGASASAPAAETAEKLKRELAKPAPRAESEVEYHVAPSVAETSPPPPPVPEPARSTPAPAKNAAPAAPRAAKGAPSADALGESSASATDDAKEVPAPKGSVGAFISLTRQVNEHARAVGQKEMLAPNSTVTATTTAGSGVMTLVGVRPDGKAFIYGQVTLTGATATITARIRPSNKRVVEALFVTVTESPINLTTAMETTYDASRLPQRLSVGGVQRRYVITVTQVE